LRKKLFADLTFAEKIICGFDICGKKIICGFDICGKKIICGFDICGKNNYLRIKISFAEILVRKFIVRRGISAVPLPDSLFKMRNC
jgi:hypothetical protein